MHIGNSVIIHHSPLIQHGLKGILLSRNIRISEMMKSIPECAIISSWKDMLLLIGVEQLEEICKHLRILKKNGNLLIGVETAEPLSEHSYSIDNIIRINDSIETINTKLTDLLSNTTDSRSNNTLSIREVEILTMVAQGLSNKQIADRLYISIHTVITHRKNITSKLGIKSISGLTLYAALNNLVDFH